MPRFAGFYSYCVHFSFVFGVPLQKVQDPSGTISYRPRMIGPIHVEFLSTFVALQKFYHYYFFLHFSLATIMIIF